MQFAEMIKEAPATSPAKPAEIGRTTRDGTKAQGRLGNLYRTN